MELFTETNKKILYAVILGPLILFPVMIVVTIGSGVINNMEVSILDLVVGGFFYGLLSLFIAYPAALIFGVPTVLLLKKIGKLNYCYLSIVTIFLSFVVFGVIEKDVYTVSYFSAVSWLVSSSCWLVYKHT